MTFKQWVKQFNKQDNAIGDLARDIGVDPEFPRKADIGTIRHYFVMAEASVECRAIFEKAAKRYTLEMKK